MATPRRSTVPDAYQPEADVNRLATYFAQRYGSLETALKTFDLHAEFDLYAFEAALKRWGVKVQSAIDLFDHLDADFSGKVSVQELFSILETPIDDLRRREQIRVKNEAQRIFEELARHIWSKFGSIEGAFDAQKLPGVPQLRDGGSTLSQAQFSKLVKGIDVELEPRQIQTVFSQVDTDATGSISVAELQSALSYHLVRETVVGLATLLSERFGSVMKAFQSIGEVPASIALEESSAVSGLPKLGTGVLASASPADAAATEQEVTEQTLLRLLRQLKVNDQVPDSTAMLLYASLRPFKLGSFIRRLEQAFRQAEDEKRQSALDHERRERAHRKLIKRAIKVDSKRITKEEVASWIQNVDADLASCAYDAVSGIDPSPSLRAATVTSGWSSCARVGASKLQLQDYIHALNAKLEETSAEVEDLRHGLERGGRELELLKDYIGPTASASVQSSRLGDLTPATPDSLRSSYVGRDPVQKEFRVVLAERLSQAAASGNQALVQSCLNQRAEVNSVVWGGVSPLMVAAHHGQVAVIDLLLSMRADLAKTDLRGRTAVDHARRQPDAASRLRGRGGLGSLEMAKEAEAIGQRLLKVRGDKERLEAAKAKQPSEDVMRRARLRHKASGFLLSESRTGLDSQVMQVERRVQLMLPEEAIRG